MLATGVDETLLRGVNPRTAKGEKSAWFKYWLPFTRRMGTAAWRGTNALVEPATEAILLAMFILDTWRKMAPRSHADTAPRVDSVRNVVSHVRRKHDRRGQTLIQNKVLSHLFRGIARQRLDEHGVSLPVRAEPFTIDQLCRMKHLPNAVIAGVPYQPESRFWAGWRMVDTYFDQTGVRKQEIVGFPDIHYLRSDVLFVVDGVPYRDPSPAVLRQFVSMRDTVRVQVNISKADFDGTRFGPSLVVSLFNVDNPMSFANAIVAYELLFPLHGMARRRTPLFTVDGSTRWSASRIDTTLSGVMHATLTAQERKGKTAHAKRVSIASGLTNLDSSETEVQALVRWSTPESLRIYARMNHMYQARKRDNLLHAHIDTSGAAWQPRIDYTEEELRACEEFAEELDIE